MLFQCVLRIISVLVSGIFNEILMTKRMKKNLDIITIGSQSTLLAFREI
jgi:hypothetical protein